MNRKTAWRKSGLHLVPACESTSEYLRDLSQGQIIMGTLKREGERNLKQFRMFWVLMSVLVSHHLFETAGQAAMAVKIALGHVDMVSMPDDGECHLIPRSISFEKMDGDEFHEFFKNAITVICQRWMQGTSDEELAAHVYEIIDGPEKSSLGKRIS